MNNIAISVENISKEYILGSNSHNTLRSSLSQLFSKRPQKISFFALQNISFEVQKGEAIGIIGRNGAGKSTLLKILSRITDPSSGKAIIEGRVASLLEVGTGFHPELTGRENIFLNGSLLGMAKNEIRDQFDDIVKFSGVEKFIDTPVKRYSSGMFVRLAFAVAAHLKSDILLVDEVLAVGDYDFRKKCLNKIQSLSKEAQKTVIFVSHNLASVEALCNRSILLEEGRIKSIGKTREIINLYKSGTKKKWLRNNIDEFRQEKRSQEVKIVSCQAKNKDGIFSADDEIVFELQIESQEVFKNLLIEIFLFNEEGEKVSEIYSWDVDKKINIDRESIRIQFSLGNLPLLQGSYFADIRIKNAIGASAMDYIERIPIFEISKNDSNNIKVKFDRKGILSIVPKISML